MNKIAFNKMATGKLPQGDSRWGEFNDSFVNREMDVVDICNEIYTGHAYTTWHNGRRKTENFVAGQHIAIDMDTEDKRSSIDTLRNHELVKLYGGIIHTTPSHTEQAPRSRVIFLLDEPIPTAAGYTAATTFLMSQFDGNDTVCKDAVRFFYGAKDCDLWFDEAVFPLEHLRTYYRKWAKTEAKAAPRHRPMRAPANPQTDVEKVQEALTKIDPWRIDYSEWIAVLAALHDSLGDSALPLAEQWAQGKEREVERKWKSFGRYSGNPAGLGSIFHLARSH